MTEEIPPAPTPAHLEELTQIEAIRTTRWARKHGWPADEQAVSLREQGFEHRHIRKAIAAVYGGRCDD